MERESDSVDGCSLFWEVGMEVIKGSEYLWEELWRRLVLALVKPGIRRWSKATSGRRFQGEWGEILSVDQTGMVGGGEESLLTELLILLNRI